MKISDCFRTRAGAERFARMRGLVETARQWEWHLLSRHVSTSGATGNDRRSGYILDPCETFVMRLSLGGRPEQ